MKLYKLWSLVLVLGAISLPAHAQSQNRARKFDILQKNKVFQGLKSELWDNGMYEPAPIEIDTSVSAESADRELWGSPVQFESVPEELLRALSRAQS